MHGVVFKYSSLENAGMLRRLLRRKAQSPREFTRRELARGIALRAFSCSTYAGQGVFLDVRCMHASEPESAFSVRARTQEGIDVPVSYEASVAVQGPSAGPDWIESRYILRVPEDAGTLYVDVMRENGRNILASARFERSYWHDELLAAYYERARNPFADPMYTNWFDAHRAGEAVLAVQRKRVFDPAPLLSLVMPVYRTPREYLRTMVDSVLAQSYANWELVIVNASPDDADVNEVLVSYDDARIRVIGHPENDGINGNTNFGIAQTRGDYVGFIDHDDVLEPDLLFEYACAIEENPGVSMLYCDEDSFETDGAFILPMFKPAMDIDLLYSNNYLLHVLMVSREIVERTTRAPDEVNGAQDYDLTLKAYELSKNVVHVPRVLYHWRVHAGSSNAGNDGAKSYVDAGCKSALDAHFERMGIDARAKGTDVPYVYQCVPSLDRASGFLRVDANTPVARNAAVRTADSELVLLAMEGIRALEQDAGSVLAAYFEREDVAVAAPRMLGPSGLSCTQWLVVRRDMGITSMGYDLPAQDGGYNGRFHRPCNVTAIDGSCCMVRRSEFLDLGGYDESFKTLAFASVDLCLRYQEGHRLVLFTPFSLFEHAQEPIQSLLPRTREHEANIAHDKALLQERWPQFVGSPDVLYNPNLDETSPYFKLGR